MAAATMWVGMAPSRSYGGGSHDFKLHGVFGIVELLAEPDGLHVVIRGAGGTGSPVSTQVLEWDQVEAWMEAARTLSDYEITLKYLQVKREAKRD